MSEKQLKQYLQKLNKEEVIELYLQKRYDQEFLETEILTNIYNQIIDNAQHQLTIFDTWDIVISQSKLDQIFRKGGIYEDSDISY